MSEYVKKFSIEDVKMYREQNEDVDFSIVEIWALAEGTNSHRNPFSKEVLEKDANTFKGKFIVAKFDEYRMDALGHETDENIVGYIDPRDEIEFKSKFVEKENKEKEFVVVKALLSKIYAKDIVDMFRINNERTVSCEFSCSTEYEENEYGKPIDEFGRVLDIENPITSYHIHAITILGKAYNPSVSGTEIKIKQFAEECEKKPTLKEIAEERIKHLSEKKEKSLDNQNNKEDKMEEEKKLSKSETDKEEKDIVMEEPKEEEKVEDAKEMSEVEDKTEEKEMSEVETEDKADETEEKEMAEQPQDEEKEMGCNKDMSEDSSSEDEEEEKQEEENKKFSLDAFADVSATMASLENETEDNKELANKVMKEMSANEIIETILTFAKENKELKEFKDATIEAQKDAKFSAIMASVKEDLDAKQFSELEAEGKELSIEELDGFANKVKAFAYEESKKHRDKKDDTLLTFADNGEEKHTSELTVDDIYKKYL